MAACNSCKTPSASRRRRACDLLQNSGGVDGLVERFQQAGLGDTLQSWISQGENLPISAERIAAGVRADTPNSLAEKPVSIRQAVG